MVFVDDDANGQVIAPKPGATTQVSGQAGSPISYTEVDALQGVPNGYQYVSMTAPAVFDSNDSVDQIITVHVSHHMTTTQITTERTIEYIGAGGDTPDPVVQTITWTVTKDDVTGDTTYNTTVPGYPDVPSPVVDGYYPDIDIVPALRPAPDEVPQSSTVTVTYEPGEVVHVVYIDAESGQVVTPAVGAQTVISGPSGSPVTFTEANARAGVPTIAGYEFDSWDPVTTFDNDPTVDQTITVHLTHHLTITEITTTRTIDYTGAGDDTPADVIQTITWTVTKDDVTGDKTYTPQTPGYPEATPEDVDGYHPDTDIIPSLPVTETDTLPQSSTLTVTYIPNTTVPGDQKVTVVYFDDETGQPIPSTPDGLTEVVGRPGTPITVTPDDIVPGIPDGYEYESIDVPATFDSDDSTDQTITVHLIHQKVITELTTTRTITCSGAGTSTDIVQTVTWTVTTDSVTGATTYTTTDTGYPEVTCPAVPGYTPNPGTVPVLPVPSSTPDKPISTTVVVTYDKITIAVKTGGTVQHDNALTLTGLASALLIGGLAIARRWSRSN